MTKKIPVTLWGIFLCFVVCLSYLMAMHFYVTLSAIIALFLAYLISKDLKKGIYLIVFVPIFGQLLRFPVSFLGGGVLVLDVCVFYVLCVYLIKRCIVMKNAPIWIRDPLAKILLLFWGFSLFTLFFGGQDLSLREIMGSGLYWVRFVMYSSLFFIVRDLFVTLEERKKLMYFFVVSAVILAILGFFQLEYFSNFLDMKLYEKGWDPHISRLTSTWLDPNFLGGYLACMVCFSLSFLLYEWKCNKHKFGVFGFTFASVIMMGAIFFTYSRSAYLTLLIGIFIVGIVHARKLLVVMAITFFLLFSSSSRLQERVNNGVMSFRAMFTESTLSLDATARLRVKSWQEGMIIFQDAPIFGVGFNTLRYENMKRGFAAFDKHSSSGFDSSLLTVATTTGMLGLFIFMWMYLMMIFRAWKNRFLKDPYYVYFGTALFACFIALFFHAFFVNSLFFPFIITNIFVLLGLLLDSKNHTKNKESD